MDLITVAPSIRTRRKSVVCPRFEDDAITLALSAIRGIPHVVPVEVDGEVIGLVKGDSDRHKAFYKPITHRQWCGFNDYKAVNDAMLAGRIASVFFRKLASSFTTANRWADLWPLDGVPGPGTYTGTADTLRKFDNTSAGGIMNFGPAVAASSMTKHILGWDVGLEGGSASTNLCAWVYDRVAAYDRCIISNLSRNMDNTLAAARYVGASEGMMVMATTDTFAALGATVSNLTTMTYVDQSGTSGQVIPVTDTLPWFASAPAASTTIAAVAACPHLVGAGEPMTPYLPLAAGDWGVRSVTNYQSSAANTGTVSFVLAKPLVPLFARANGPRQRVDITHSTLGLERIYDDACMSVVVGRVVSTEATFSAILRIGWS